MVPDLFFVFFLSDVVLESKSCLQPNYPVFWDEKVGSGVLTILKERHNSTAMLYILLDLRIPPWHMRLFSSSGDNQSFAQPISRG
jgi:hypothetical protein